MLIHHHFTPEPLFQYRLCYIRILIKLVLFAFSEIANLTLICIELQIPILMDQNQVQK